MEANKTLSFWGKACQIGAGVDLATQLISSGLMFCELFEYDVIKIVENTSNLQLRAILAISIVSTTIFIIVFFLYAILMMKINTSPKGWEIRDVKRTTGNWRICQYVILLMGACSIALGNWEFGLFEIFVRIILFCIATKFVNELKKVTENIEDLERAVNLERMPTVPFRNE